MKYLSCHTLEIEHRLVCASPQLIRSWLGPIGYHMETTPLHMITYATKTPRVSFYSNVRCFKSDWLLNTQSKVLQADWLTMETPPISKILYLSWFFWYFLFLYNSTSFMSRFTAVCLFYVSDLCVFDATSWEQNLIMILYDVKMILSFMAPLFCQFQKTLLFRE